MKSRKLLLHILLILAVIAGIFLVTIKYLAAYTNHGEYVLVPDYSGQRIAGLETLTEGKGVTYQIIDSVYDPREKPGLVLRQDPEPGSKVKHNRKVYLYVTCQVPPQIEMPRLVDRSERQARFIIETYGLKVGRVEQKKADCNGCVLSQSVKGREIPQGQPVKKGSVVDLVVGVKDAFFTGNDSLQTNESVENKQ
jgi:eukaryotic-like serine/threonine-protein kinase